MPRQPFSPTAFPATPFVARLSDDQISRLAEMITDGRCELPKDLQLVDLASLQNEVRRRLRERVVRLVARAIAQHLHRNAGHCSEVKRHVGT